FLWPPILYKLVGLALAQRQPLEGDSFYGMAREVGHFLVGFNSQELQFVLGPWPMLVKAPDAQFSSTPRHVDNAAAQQFGDLAVRARAQDAIVFRTPRRRLSLGIELTNAL